MAIVFDKEHKTITIHTDNSTYQMLIDRYGYLIHLYYGARSEGCMDWLLYFADRGFSGAAYDVGMDRTYSLDSLPQEFPVQGTGDFRSSALIIRDHNGTFGCDLRYRSHEIHRGKYSLGGLPAVYSESENDDAETLRIILGNERTGLEVTLLYGVLPHLDIITRSAVVRNTGRYGLTVERLQTACLDFVSGDFDLITFHGRHTLERQPDRAQLSHASHAVGSRRGMSSHQYNPFVILADHQATETAGRCWAMQMVYSGGFRAEAELDQYDQVRLLMGLAEEKFSYPLEPGESLTAPEVIMTFSSRGLEKISHSLHKCINMHICRGKYRDAVRPVLINSWEAAYFNFTGDLILALADQASNLGIDLLVMDDGWFGSRNDDLRALGDWSANEKKLGMTLGELVRRVNDKGMKFGIWVEPEMISEDSDLYRRHPDWAMKIPGEKPVLGRNQLVLDFSRREVVEELYLAICGILDQGCRCGGSIEYMKWDYNRSIADVYSHTANNQGRVLYDYMLGLYGMLERLNRRYPDLLIEGCSGGGGRFDAGMLYYTPQIWCSDNTDAIDRLVIQYGTSFGYPSSAVGAHVSACPNHQTGRIVPLKTRAAVAMSGTFGYELDPAKLSEEDRAEIREQIKAFRRYSELIRNGLYYRLTDPLRDGLCAWSHVAEDGSKALITVVIPQSHGNRPTPYIVPRGLTGGASYRDEKTGRIYSADALMDMGFHVPIPSGDAESYIIELKRI